jgi:hypothetical protein
MYKILLLSRKTNSDTSVSNGASVTFPVLISRTFHVVLALCLSQLYVVVVKYPFVYGIISGVHYCCLRENTYSCRIYCWRASPWGREHLPATSINLCWLHRRHWKRPAYSGVIALATPSSADKITCFMTASTSAQPFSIVSKGAGREIGSTTMFPSALLVHYRAPRPIFTSTASQVPDSRKS